MAHPHELHKMLCQAFDGDTDPASPRHENPGDSEGMHCALLEWAASQDHLALHLQAALLRLCKLMDEGGSIALSQKDIAKAIRLSERQTHTVIKELVGAGVLVRKRQGEVRKGRRPDLLSANRDNCDIRATTQLSHDNRSEPQLPQDREYRADNRSEEGEKSAPLACVEDNPSKILDLDNLPSPIGEDGNSHTQRARATLPEPLQAIFDGVASPYLDPHLAPTLILNARHIDTWLKSLTLEDIIEAIRAELAPLNGHGKPVLYWSDFDLVMRKLITKRKQDEARRIARERAKACLDELWRLWPQIGRQRSSKAKAQAALEKRKEEPAAILAAARRYLASKDIARADSTGAKGLHCWINDRLDAFLDEAPNGEAPLRGWMEEMWEEIQAEAVAS